MDGLRVEDTAIFEGIQRYVKQHDEILATKGGLDERMRHDDSAAIYILTAQRDVDAGDYGDTTIEARVVPPRRHGGIKDEAACSCQSFCPRDIAVLTSACPAGSGSSQLVCSRVSVCGNTIQAHLAPVCTA